MLDRNATRPGIEWNVKTGYNDDGSVRVLDSFDLFVDPTDESVATCLIRDGFWEAWITSWMTKVIEPDWLCLDIGANYGYYTGVMAELGGSVVAFEPNPEIASKVSMSREKNGWENVSLKRVGLGATEGRAVLTMNSHLQGSASLLYGERYFLEYGDDVVMVEVDVKTLDSYDLKPDFVKMDVEGFEPGVFMGGTETLSHAKIMAVELTKDHPAEFLDMLFDRYNVTFINADGGENAMSREAINHLDWAMVALRRK